MIGQIYHDPAQYAGLLFKPVSNPPTAGERYLFMESAVLARESAGCNDEWFGIFSPNAASKAPAVARFANEAADSKAMTDAEVSAVAGGASLILFEGHPAHDTFGLAERYHPGFLKLSAYVLAKVKFPHSFRSQIAKPFYCNYFAVRTHIFRKFAYELLLPAMEVIESDPLARNMAMANASYYKPFPAELKKIYGLTEWPFHPFFAERLFPLWLNYNPQNTKYYGKGTFFQLPR
jgi:hypothetical protein